VEVAPERPVKSQKLDTESPVPLSLDDDNDHCGLEIFKCLSPCKSFIRSQSSISSATTNYEITRIKLGQEQSFTRRVLPLIPFMILLLRSNGIKSLLSTVLVSRLLALAECQSSLQRSKGLLTLYFRRYLVWTCRLLLVHKVEFSRFQVTAMLRLLQECFQILKNLTLVTHQERQGTWLIMCLSQTRRIKGCVCHDLIGMAGIRLFQISDSLTELHLDNCQLYILSP